MPDAILGLSAYYHDSAAALLVDGELVAAAHEERFTRKKHDISFPSHAAGYVLREGGVRLDQLSAIAFYDKPYLKFERLLETYHELAPRGLPSFLAAIPIWIKEIISSAGAVFVNAVMGRTPHFTEGTVALFKALDDNKTAYKMYGGGDTLQEFRTLLPGKYLNAVDDPKYYFFSGGGTVLTAIEENSVLGLEPVKVLTSTE